LSWRLAPLVAQPIGMPARSVRVDHFQPSFPSAGFLPFLAPPVPCAGAVEAASVRSNPISCRRRRWLRQPAIEDPCPLPFVPPGRNVVLETSPSTTVRHPPRATVTSRRSIARNRFCRVSGDDGIRADGSWSELAAAVRPPPRQHEHVGSSARMMWGTSTWSLMGAPNSQLGRATTVDGRLSARPLCPDQRIRSDPAMPDRRCARSRDQSLARVMRSICSGCGLDQCFAYSGSSSRKRSSRAQSRLRQKTPGTVVLASLDSPCNPALAVLLTPLLQEQDLVGEHATSDRLRRGVRTGSPQVKEASLPTVVPGRRQVSHPIAHGDGCPKSALGDRDLQLAINVTCV